MKIVGIAACTAGIAHTYMAREKLINAFDLRSEMEELHLKGVVSRKKQLVPALVEALQQ